MANFQLPYLPTILLINKDITYFAFIPDKPGKIKRMTITLHSDDRLGYGLSIYFSSKANSAVISSIIQGGPADT